MTHALNSLSTGQEGIKMSDEIKEIFDQDIEQPVAENSQSHADAFKKFVEPEVGEPGVSSQKATDKEAADRLRKSLNVATPSNPVTKPEVIVANQYHQETIEASEARNSRPKEKSHIGAKILLGFTSFATALGLIHVAADRQENVDRISDEKNAPRIKGINDNVVDRHMSEAVKNGNVAGKETTQYVSDDETFEVDNKPKQ